MTTKSRLALLSSLAATPVFAAPFLAIGDNAELYLTLRTEGQYQDNVTYAPDADKFSDEVFEFTPGAEVLFGKNSLTTGSLTVFERFLAYSDHTELNEELANILFKSKFEGAKLQLVTDASFKELNQNSRDEKADKGRLVRRDTTAAGIGSEYAATEKSKLGLAFRYDKTHYITDGLTDRDTYIVPVNYYFEITPKVDLSAGVQYRVNDIKDTKKDSDELYYNVGARGEFTPKLSGSFSVGYRTRSPDVGDDEGMLGLDAGLVYLYSPKTQFTLDLSNDFQSSSDGGGQEVSSINFGVSSAIATALTARATFGYEQVDYMGDSNRQDDYFTFMTGVTYTVNQYMSVELYYTYLDNSSDEKGAEFNANILSLAANFRY